MGRFFYPEILIVGISCLSVVLAQINTPLYRRNSPNFNALNKTLGGTLARGVPLAEPCYSNYNGTATTPNSAQCSTVQTNYENELFIAQNFGGYDNTEWAICQANSQGCNLNFSNPTAPVPAGSVCYQGSVPTYYIPVRNVSDVQTALSFACNSRVPLVVKNTGHDFKGRSSGPNTLALWMYPYKPAITLTKGFIPEGCSSSAGDGVTVGAGHSFDDLFTFSGANNITVVGGSSQTVGAAGGWLTGGGHSPISNKFGLGVDNALQIKAVLANGTYVTANRCKNSDLFFALRGGGGNAFGVNMEVTYRAHPQVTVQVAYAEFVATNLTTYSQFISLLTQNANKWAGQGWGGYVVLGGGARTSVGLAMYNTNLSQADANVSIAPIMSFVNSSASAETLASGLVTLSSYYQAYQIFIQSSGEKVGLGNALSSRLIPKSLLATKQGQAKVATALSNISNNITYPTSPFQKDPLSPNYGAPLQILMTTPYNYNPPAGESFTDSSVTPAWRNATWHVCLSEYFSNEANITTIQTLLAAVSSEADILRKLTPDSGAYQNEADVFEPDPINSYWGRANYNKLKAIKKQVDPTNILTCWGCIGWNPNDPRYSCYPSIPGFTPKAL